MHNKTSQQKEWQFVANWGIGITFNEPDEITAIEAFAALGFTAIAIGGGRYILRRKKNTVHKGDTMTKNYITSKTMWVNFVAIVAIVAQGQFGFVIDPAAQAAMIVMINMVLRAITGEELSWNTD